MAVTDPRPAAPHAPANQPPPLEGSRPPAAPPASANQPPPLEGRNLFADDPVLAEALEREGGGWGRERLVAAVSRGTHSSASSGCSRSAGTAANVIVSGQPKPASAWTAHW